MLHDGAERVLASFDASFELGRRSPGGFGDDPFVSLRHIAFEPFDAIVRVRDLDSLNGVFVRLPAHHPLPLVSGDVFLVGAQVLRFELLDGAVAPGAVADDTNVFGSPSRARLAQLTEVTCEGIARSTYVIGSESVLIGREGVDVVYTDDPHLSRRHAELGVRSGFATLTDLGSSNGTFVRIRGEAELAGGTQLRVGQQRLRLDRMNNLENRGGA